MTPIDKPLTNLQLELLKLYSLDLSEQQLLDVKRVLARYFADEASDEMDRLWDQEGLNNDTIDNWLRGEDHF